MHKAHSIIIVRQSFAGFFVAVDKLAKEIVLCEPDTAKMPLKYLMPFLVWICSELKRFAYHACLVFVHKQSKRRRVTAEAFADDISIFHLAFGNSYKQLILSGKSIAIDIANYLVTGYGY